MAPRFGFPAFLLVAAFALGGCAATQELYSGYSTETMEDGPYYYDDLASYGTWVDVPGYGMVWCPEVAAAWQPYTVGTWVYTDDGWFWVSEDPWGSVPYHYGRWALDHDYGWVWVPGDVWAPAWVAWRFGSGWVGWAPLPPDIVWNVHLGTDLDPSDLDRHVDHRYWSFTRAEDFGTHRERVRVEPFDKNGKLLKATRNVTRYAAGSHPVETGMNPVLLQEHRGTVQRYRIVDSSQPVPKSGAKIREKQIRVAQREDTPRVAPRSPDVVNRPEEPSQDRREDVERQEPVRQRPEPARERRETVPESGEKAQARVADDAPKGESVKRQREEAVRQREEDVPRQSAAQQRKEAARQREEAIREGEESAREPMTDSAKREREAPSKRVRGGPAR